MKNFESLSQHVASGLAAVGAVVALVHPGFVIPPFVQGLTVTICVAVAGLIQIIHLVLKHKTKGLVTAIITAAKQIESTTQYPTAS